MCAVLVEATAATGSRAVKTKSRSANLTEVRLPAFWFANLASAGARDYTHEKGRPKAALLPASNAATRYGLA
jgi:hypothetical protein